jgi:DNA-binding winged helix-turn-helix (wHTH) protein
MQWHFGPFRLDLTNAGLWRAEQPVPLRPKTFALLAYLVTHAGELVTKETLFATIWPETAVSDGVLKTSMSELRKALGETAKAPQWIATVQGRGYRFVALATMDAPAPPPAAATALPPVLAPAPVLPPTPIRAPVSSPSLVAREAGIGKTTLVDAFVAQLAGQTPLWIGHGQCIEQYGAGEAYLPLLEAPGQMGRTPEGPYLVRLLRQQAPSWLLQLPAFLS